VSEIRSYLIDILDGPKRAKVPSGSRANALLQGACEIASSHLKIKKYYLLPLFLTFLLWCGSLCIVHSVIAQDENAQEVVVDLDEINVFDDQRNELLGLEWQEIELKLAKLQETYKTITQVDADETESSVFKKQSAEQPEADSQIIETQEIKLQKTETDEVQLQEAIKALAQVEADESKSSDSEQQTEEQPETEIQEIESQEAETQEAEPNETQPQEAINDSTQGEPEKVSDTVELNGDIVEYSIDGNNNFTNIFTN